MKFDEQNKVLIDTLNPTEARAYISFLLEEQGRHIFCLNDAGERARVESTNEYRKALGKFWKSAVARHQDDIRDIKALIEKVRGLFDN